jgi:serine/threonine-protein kinase
MSTREQFGGYLLLKKLAEDPLGETFRGGKLTPQGLERVVLLRIFNGPGLDGERLWQRSAGRAPLQQALKNPNLGDGVDLGQVRGNPYVAYDYVSGKNLATVLEQAERKRSPLPLDHALLLAERMALGLSVASESRLGPERVLHGFLVPHLLMISNEGEARLLGFEVAPGLREVATSAGARDQFGRYLAPEALGGAAADRSDDVYSLGAILYELLTGKRLPPPAASGYGPIVDQATLSSDGAPLPAEIAALLKRSLAPREQRMGDVATWHKALAKLMIEGHYNPTTFNLAFFMHNLFRDEIDREAQEIAAEKRIQIAPGAAARGTAAPAAAAAPRFGLSEPAVAPEPMITAQAASAGTRKGLWIGIAAAVALLAGIGAAFVLRRGGEEVGAAAAPTTAATGAPAAAAAPEVPAPAGPSPEELQTQIDTMIAERLAASQETLKKSYDEQLRTLQKQLDDARRTTAERQAANRPAPAAEPPSPAAAEPEPPPREALAEPAPVPPPAAAAADQAPAPAVAAPPPATPPQAPAESPETAAALPAAEAAPQVRAGELVQPGPGVVRPTLLRRPAPRYPEIARRTKREATVAVSVLVDENGRVQDARLKSAKSGYGFDEAAIEAARRSTFKPATKNGVPVKMWYDLNINFKPQ